MDNEIKETVKKKTEKLVKIRIPRIKGDESDVYVSVNARTWLIKRGVEVEVPECVAEVLRNSEDMQEEAYAYSSSKESK